jgi:hypothetical protein
VFEEEKPRAGLFINLFRFWEMMQIAFLYGWNDRSVFKERQAGRSELIKVSKK